MLQRWVVAGRELPTIQLIYMLDKLKQLFGFGYKVDYAYLVKQGAIILDVRSKGEFAGGHIKGSIKYSDEYFKY